MPSDPPAELTHLQEQEARAVQTMGEHQRRLTTLQALLQDARRRGEAPGAVEAQTKAAGGGIARAERGIATLRARIGTAEQALPADLRDPDEEA